MDFEEPKHGSCQPQETLVYPSDGDDRRYYASQRGEQEERSPYNPKSWSLKVKIGVILGIIIVALIIVIIPVAVTLTRKNNSYPDYAELAYSLADTCKRKNISMLGKNWQTDYSWKRR
jgi:hypothetical protein